LENTALLSTIHLSGNSRQDGLAPEHILSSP